MKSRTMLRATAIGAVCALAGAGAGIAGSSAATKPRSTTTGTTTTTQAPPTGGPRGDRGHGGPAVHSVETVLNKAGTAYITETEDQGTVKSVSGSDVVITEGTTAVPYKDVTVTVPAGATIRRNGKTATVADLKAGDQVRVSVSSDGADVDAHDASFKPTGPKNGGPGHGPSGTPPAAPSGTTTTPSTGTTTTTK